MFTEVTAAEWGPHGVRANCIAVGGIASERAKAAWEVAGIDAAAIGEGAMLRRVGRPEEVAAAILFLVSDAASYITAQTISVDGGHPMGGIGDT
jgi:3-oxoacyl-[acyl-carrier protein] reductase